MKKLFFVFGLILALLCAPFVFGMGIARSAAPEYPAYNKIVFNVDRPEIAIFYRAGSQKIYPFYFSSDQTIRRSDFILENVGHKDKRIISGQIEEAGNREGIGKF